ncbi:hypothetical protein SAMN05216357_1264 [Porphyromonadaceae bacterium KH3CP3RA]|nr:hypothetical protein SAMN05216357_1264 [Porphyromonadaceae bacterium KH3CP3RA]
MKIFLFIVNFPISFGDIRKPIVIFFYKFIDVIFNIAISVIEYNCFNFCFFGNVPYCYVCKPSGFDQRNSRFIYYFVYFFF